MDSVTVTEVFGAIAAFGAIVIPQLTELVKHYKMPKWLHVVLAMVIAGITGVASITLTPDSLHSIPALAGLAGTAWGAAVLAYHAVWEPTGVSDAIGRKTGSLPPADGPWTMTYLPGSHPLPVPVPDPEPENVTESTPVAEPAPAPEPEPVAQPAEPPAEPAAVPEPSIPDALTAAADALTTAAAALTAAQPPQTPPPAAPPTA